MNENMNNGEPLNQNTNPNVEEVLNAFGPNKPETNTQNSKYEKLNYYLTSENDIYFKANFDLEERSGGIVEPITEIQYTEKYLEEIKKREKEKEEQSSQT